MIARFCLVLLLTLLSLPAAAMPACHEAPATTSHASGHYGGNAPAPAERPDPIDVACIGCIAPAAARVPVLDSPILSAAVIARPAMARGAPLRDRAPDTPPPRIEG